MPILMRVFERLKVLRQQAARSDLVRILGAIVAVATVGSVGYGVLEGWSPLDAIYATVITITTVGYGDLSPQTPGGRIFAIFFTVFAISIGGYAISTLAVNLIERRSRNQAAKFRKRLMTRIGEMRGHYILCGADLVGTRIAEELHLQGAAFVVIDDDEARLKTTLLFSHPEYFRQKLRTMMDFHEADLSEFEELTLPELSEKVNVPYLLADPMNDSVLVQAGIERAAGLIATREDDRDNLSIVIGARSLATRARNEGLRIMTRANDGRNMRKMYLAGADFVRIPNVMSGLEMASHMLHPEIGNWWYSRVGESDARRSLFEQVALSEKPDWVGKTVGELHRVETVLILTVKRAGTFVSPPPHDLKLEHEDTVITLR